MIAPRWRKVLADLFGNKTRTFLVVLTITVGVFAVGFVSNLAGFVLSDVEADYQAANPRSGIIYCDPFDADLLVALRRVPGVASVDGRSELSARVLTGPDTKLSINLAAIPPLDQISVDLLRPQPAGAQLTLADHEILIERSALSTLPLKAGDRLTLELPGGLRRELRVAGFVHDVNAPMVFRGAPISAYITSETMWWLGGARQYTEVYFTGAENTRDQAYVESVGENLKRKIEASGRQVSSIYVSQPGQPPSANLLQGLLAILGLLSGLVICLSAFLVINTIMGLLAQHTRQIGVMKAIGGSTEQIVAMYMGLVLGFGFLALILAVPLAATAGYGVARLLAQTMNFDLAGFRLPLEAVARQTAIALGVPVAAALFPILNSARLTIRAAIASYGLGQGRFGESWMDRLLGQIRFLSRPMLISVRNTFRRKLRLALTLSTLTLGGAIFISIFNLWGAFRIIIAESQGYFLSDINISFDRAVRLDRLAPLVAAIPGVTSLEGWASAPARLYAPGKNTTAPIVFMAPPANATSLQPVLLAGRWLAPADENAIVIGNRLLALRPELKVGDTVIIQLADQDRPWRIVGVYKLAESDTPMVYTNYEYLSRLLVKPGQVYSLNVITASHDLATQTRIAQQLESVFKLAGIPVTNVQTGEGWRQSLSNGVAVLVYLLLVMAVLIAAVGGLGLTGTLSLNVLERTREIGVIRAIGASDGTVLQIVMAEGLLMGVISWLLGVLLSLPLTLLLDYSVGLAFMGIPFNFTFGWDGVMLWLVGVLVIAALASALPAWNTMQLTIRAVLVYE